MKFELEFHNSVIKGVKSETDHLMINMVGIVYDWVSPVKSMIYVQEVDISITAPQCGLEIEASDVIKGSLSIDEITVDPLMIPLREKGKVRLEIITEEQQIEVIGLEISIIYKGERKFLETLDV